MLAQEPLNPPTPLAPPPADSSAGRYGLALLAAQRGQELGFPGIAAGIYRELLAAPGAEPSLPGYDAANRTALTLALATALLDDGRPAEADRALNSLAGPRGSAWHLRRGLAGAALKNFETAKKELADTKPADLPATDKPWYYFLQGILAGAAGDTVQAGNFYQQAERAADTDLARARFLLAHEQARLRVGEVNEAMVEQTRENAERFRGTATGCDFERSYAVMLDALGRKGAAVEALQHDLLTLPPSERARADDFRLLLGLVAGASDGAGRSALIQLLESNGDPDRQRVALQLLGRALVREPARSLFRSELDKLIASPGQHPILDDLLLMRANLALGERDYAQAEESAHALLERFPGSPLKPHALGLLAGSAWEQLRYRTAADYARQTRDALPAGPSRARMSVVVAEAWFRAGDFRSAADAYSAVLRDPPAGIPPGDLMFQSVEAEIKAGALNDAQSDLDQLARNPAFDAVNRWEAEWNLSRALQLGGRTAEAYERVSRLLTLPPAGGPAGRAGLPADLRAQMCWLQARLSLDIREPRTTLRLVDSLAGTLANVSAELRLKIASAGTLLKAQAYFDLKQESDALGLMKKLRADYPRSDAAVSSYFVEAEHYAEQDKIVKAQQLLTQLADDFPKSAYAPYALYQAAFLAERLGQDKDLVEANRLIERLVTTYPAHDLVFDARLRQGDLMRKLNRFSLAEQDYQSLINNYARNPDVILARLALAETYNAQSAGDPSHEERARALFEDLCDRVDAKVDVRVEAGFNLGYIYKRRGRLDQAEEVWWRDVVSAFLLTPEYAGDLRDKGRYWMARTLLELGALFEQEGKLDQAGDAWRLILKTGLPFAAVARSNLAGLAPPSAPP